MLGWDSGCSALCGVRRTSALLNVHTASSDWSTGIAALGRTLGVTALEAAHVSMNHTGGNIITALGSAAGSTHQLGESALGSTEGSLLSTNGNNETALSTGCSTALTTGCSTVLSTEWSRCASNTLSTGCSNIDAHC